MDRRDRLMLIAFGALVAAVILHVVATVMASPILRAVEFVAIGTSMWSMHEVRKTGA